MTEKLLEALRMGFDVSIKYRDVDDCYVVKVSRNKCCYAQVIDGAYMVEELINVCIRYGMKSIVQLEEAKTEKFSEKTKELELDQDAICIATSDARVLKIPVEERIQEYDLYLQGHIESVKKDLELKEDEINENIRY